MEKNLFIEKMSNENGNVNEWPKLIEETCLKDGQITKGLITAEECSELIKEVTKMARCKGDRNNLLQELADVIVCGMFQCYFNGFTKEELIKAVSVKLKECVGKKDPVYITKNQPWKGTDL